MDQLSGQRSSLSIALLSGPALLAVVSGFWLQRISTEVPEPYLDEVFHIRQAQAYCAGKYAQWDPKITTPPGLYMLSAAFSAVFNRCDIKTLRALNVLGILGVFFQAFGIHLRRNRQKEPVAEQLQSQDENDELLQKAYMTHTSLNIALFPPLFFFSVLYYTDVLSTLYVMMNYDLFLRTSNTKYARLWTSIEIVFSGLLALLCRQTNIFWVAVFPAALTIVRALKDAATKENKQLSYKHPTPTFSECANDAWASGCVYDGPVRDASFIDFLKTPLTLVLAAARNPVIIVGAVWPYIFLVGLFGTFVVWNGGVVLGDKSNHVATIHLPQMLYIWPYIFFFSWPLLYLYLIRLLWPIMWLTLPEPLLSPLQRIPGVFSTLMTTPSPHPSDLVRALGILSLLASAVIYFNTIIHPFTLADNRHYVFYVFRILRLPLIKYLVTPVYGLCAWSCIQGLGGHASPQTVVLTDDSKGSSETKTKPREVVLRDDSDDGFVSFLLIWLLTTALALCSAPLVEPRYCILPWIMWRLHVPARRPIRDPRVSKAGPRYSAGSNSSSLVRWLYNAYDRQLWLETLWFLAVNAVTGYVFLYRGFEWVQEPGKVQRFMW
ncbi:glycosyltransferase family 59 protein [Viridothelium virens]|uniref:Dol-P-Glc:Glc(2)Man(9)GlcNAc(2)-PP-Dol alpha-1,2-glucosyltransferase n=1 Tax=Viridothelium virens TaxID=1048519 RepID=A0A6A6H745_VIRVR|nr:glycosyltransferase family 59 protein [Viridothelium virens]